MERYRLLKKGWVEGVGSFEKRLNEECRKGYRAISVSQMDGATVVLLEKNS
jgi:hypothetical protein